MLKFIGVLAVLFVLPITASAARYFVAGDGDSWRTADRSSAGLLPDPASHADAIIRVFAARTVRWRGAFAVHSWIVIKEQDAARYTRYDYTAWGEPIRVNGFAPDGRWFGRTPDLIAAADGVSAQMLIPRIKSAVHSYELRNYGDYRAWPGPNSNTFVAAVLGSVPELGAVLPPTAIGKDYPHDGRIVAATPSGTGFRLSLGGFVGVTIAWVEGLEVNLLGAVLGLDLRRPAIKLPGFGRIGLATG